MAVAADDRFRDFLSSHASIFDGFDAEQAGAGKVLGIGSKLADEGVEDLGAVREEHGSGVANCSS